MIGIHSFILPILITQFIPIYSWCRSSSQHHAWLEIKTTEKKEKERCVSPLQLLSAKLTSRAALWRLADRRKKFDGEKGKKPQKKHGVGVKGGEKKMKMGAEVRRAGESNRWNGDSDREMMGELKKLGKDWQAWRVRRKERSERQGGKKKERKKARSIQTKSSTRRRQEKKDEENCYRGWDVEMCRRRDGGRVKEKVKREA